MFDKTVERVRSEIRDYAVFAEYAAKVRIVTVDVNEYAQAPITIQARFISAMDTLSIIGGLADLHLSYAVSNEVRLVTAKQYFQENALRENLTIPKAVCDAFPTVEEWNNALKPVIGHEFFGGITFDSTNRTLTVVADGSRMEEFFTILDRDIYTYLPHRYRFDIEKENGSERLLILDTYFNNRYLIAR